VSVNHKEDEVDAGNVKLFPLEKTRAWRAIEIAALRSAGGGSVSMNRIRAYLRREFRNVPRAMLEAEIARVGEYVKERLYEHRVRCGLARQSRDQTADVVRLPEPPPAA
jgi:hypothetical protein